MSRAGRDGGRGHGLVLISLNDEKLHTSKGQLQRNDPALWVYGSECCHQLQDASLSRGTGALQG